jgi:hypothetical protein
VTQRTSSLWRRSLPWIVSATALGYVFGYATDWHALVEATRNANVPLYVTYTALDKLIFFLWWGVLQASAVRRFVTPVSTPEVVAVRGGAELVRTVNGALGDAAFVYGMARLTRGHVAAVMAAFGVPIVCHFVVLLLQTTLALAFLEGGAAGNRDVALAVVLGWTLVATVAVLMRVGLWERIVASERVGSWLRNVTLRTILPFLGWFALFALFDVLIQGLASRAFGIRIDWWALAGRIPILYFFISLPSFGNFGTREIAWTACFSEFGPRDTLIAYAFATNSLFLLFHVLIGVVFLPRAITLIRDVRQARREGAMVPEPLLHDASDP